MPRIVKPLALALGMIVLCILLWWLARGFWPRWATGRPDINVIFKTVLPDLYGPCALASPEPSWP